MQCNLVFNKLVVTLTLNYIWVDLDLLDYIKNIVYWAHARVNIIIVNKVFWCEQVKLIRLEKLLNLLITSTLRVIANGTFLELNSHYLVLKRCNGVYELQLIDILRCENPKNFSLTLSFINTSRIEILRVIFLGYMRYFQIFNDFHF